MRAAVVFASLLPACGDNGPGPTPAELDAAPSMPIDAPPYREPCDSPAGTAAITAAHQDLQPNYARMYAGGIFTLGDSGGTAGFDLRAFFTNEALTTAQQVFDCEGDSITPSTCPSVGVVVEVLFERGDELGVHAAQIRSSAAAWQAIGTVTLTDFVYPENTVGHLAGSIHVDSTAPLVTIDGSFDHTFCIGLLAVEPGE